MRRPETGLRACLLWFPFGDTAHKNLARITRGVVCLSLICLSGCATLTKLGFWDAPPPMKFGSPDATGVVIVDCTVLCYIPDIDDNEDDFVSFRLLIEQQLEKGWVRLVDLPGPDTTATLKGAVITNLSGDSIEGTPTDLYNEVARNLLIFPDLPPGNYHLSQLLAGYTLSKKQMERHYGCDGSSSSTWMEAFLKDCTDELEFAIVLPAGSADRLSFRIDPGDTKYVGRMIIADLAQPPFGSRKVVDKELYNIDGHNVWFETYADRHTQNLADDFVINDNPAHEAGALQRLIKK